MLTQDDLDAIRRIVREELDRPNVRLRTAAPIVGTPLQPSNDEIMDELTTAIAEWMRGFAGSAERLEDVKARRRERTRLIRRLGKSWDDPITVEEIRALDARRPKRRKRPE